MPLSRAKQQAFDFKSCTERPSESSIYKGTSISVLSVLSSLSHSSLFSLPLRIFLPSISQAFDMSRFKSCTLDNSNEKKAIGIFWSAAIFFAIDSAKAVFPISDSPDTITRFAFCNPFIISSSLSKPVEMP